MIEKHRHEEEGDPELSRAYRAASEEEPPRHLDDAILAAARRSANRRPRSGFSPFGAGWRVPVALAAVLVLCVSLVVTMQQETRDAGLPEAPAPMQPIEDADIPVISGKKTGEAREARPVEGKEAPGAVKQKPADTADSVESEDRRPAARPLLNREYAAPERESAPRAALRLDRGVPPSDTDSDTPPDEWLAEIDRLWRADEKEQAARQLRWFLETYPKYDKNRLENMLEPALLEAVIPVPTPAAEE